MATATKKNVKNLRSMGGVPYGNGWNQQYTFSTNASGVFVDSDQTTAIAVADVVRIGILPAGLTMHDSLSAVSDAFTALTTANVGFAYVDGVDSTAVPQDAAYFNTALALNALGITRKTGTKAPITLPKDAYLILTNAGAAHASVGVLDVIVYGIGTGTP